MSTTSEFEHILYRAYELAVHYQHEYVSQEHLLYAILPSKSVIQVLDIMQVNITQLKNQLQDFLSTPEYHSMVPDVRFQPKYTTTLLTTMKQAKTQSYFFRKNEIDGVDLMIAMFNTEHSWAVYFLEQSGVTKEGVIQALQNEPQNAVISTHDARMLLSQYAVNLNHRAQHNKIDPLIGRESDVWLITQTLARKTKNNPLLVGPPGVGKTQIVEGLALRITQQLTPPILWDKEIWSLDVSAIVAGTKFRGDFEERMKQLISAVKNLPDVILFIDEIHMILGAGSGGGQSNMDVANILKPALGRGEIRTIGSTTEDEFRRHFEKDRALLRRFQKQNIQEPSVADSKLILVGVAESMAKYHGVTYDPDITDACVDLSVKYIQHKHLPDKAIDILDAVSAAVKIDVNHASSQVTLQDVHAQVSRFTGVDVETVAAQESVKIKQLKTHMLSQVFGQDAAVNQVVEHVWMSLSGLRENNRTLGAFLMHGPTGVGKTELARALSDHLGYTLVRMDMSEFMEKHTVSRLLGAPPGYVGYSDGQAGSGALINALEQSPQCVLLIDEVEKAHPDVLNIFLQAMDRGEITSSNQKTQSMRNVILMFTSNLGAQESQKEPLGFGREATHVPDLTAINQFFAPEFRNRLDKIIHFAPLTSDTMQHVLDKFLNNLNQLCEARQVKVVLDPDARAWLIRKGFDAQMGARPLSRCMDEHIKKPMSQEMLFGKLQQGGTVLVSVKQDQLHLSYLKQCVNHTPDWKMIAQDWETHS
jgi:ATP-dependent Clp protease ATP-binding subunit ClpA